MARLEKSGKTTSDRRVSRFSEILSLAEVEDVSVEDGQGQNRPQALAMASIDVREQPRRYFDPQKMEELINSVREHGVLENLLVRPVGDRYELVAGERRFRAAQAAGLKEVPVNILQLTDAQAAEISLVENLQREDLNPVEETEGILNLLSIRLSLSTEEAVRFLHQMWNESRGKLTSTHNVVGSPQGQQVTELFESIGRFTWESYYSHRLPLLKLPEDVLDALRAGKLEYTKANAIARVKDADDRANLLDAAIAEQLSLSQIKERIKTNKQTTSSDEESPSLKIRFTETYKRVNKSDIWNDPKKAKKIEGLLEQIERLLG